MPNYVGFQYELFGNVTAFRCTLNKCCSRVPARGQRDFYRFTEAGFVADLRGVRRDPCGIFAGFLRDLCGILAGLAGLWRDRTGFSRDCWGYIRNLTQGFSIILSFCLDPSWLHINYYCISLL